MNLQQPLLVHSFGAVSPCGCGVERLARLPPRKREERSVSDPPQWFEIFCVDPKWPELLRWREHPRLRRASLVSYFLLEAAQEALSGLPDARKRKLGMIACFGTGSVCYSHKFYAGFLHTGKRLASPALFPETVYNAPLSHLAAVIGSPGPAYALVGDESAWLGALRVARTWLAVGTCELVLVVGGEELDAIALEAFGVCGWLKKGKPFRPSEGAAALLLGVDGSEPLFRIGRIYGEWSYRGRAEARIAAGKVKEALPPGALVVSSARRNWLASLERQTLSGHPQWEPEHYLGEAFTASAGWNTILAGRLARQRKSPVHLPIWGMNYGIGLLEILPP